MARIAMVTRTVKAWNVVVGVIDIHSNEVTQAAYMVDGRLEREKAEAEAMKLATTDTIKPFMVKSIEMVEQLYGMTEADFIKYATPMNDRFEKI